METYNEGSTPLIPIEFLDALSALVTPTTANYTITDVLSGNTIRATTSIGGLASKLSIRLTTADTAIVTDTNTVEERLLAVAYTYSGGSGTVNVSFQVANRPNTSSSPRTNVVREWLNDIEEVCTDAGRPVPDRLKLLNWLSAELNELSQSGKLPADWFYAKMDSIPTVSGTREYDLPDNFGTNFVRHAGQRFYQILNFGGDKWACFLNDGTKDSPLSYESPAQFYSKNLYAESTGRPSVYTVMTASDGQRQIMLSTLPDNNGGSNYTIWGIYQPTDWRITSETQVPVLPNHSPILKYGVLRRLMPDRYQPLYREAFDALIMAAAQERVAQFVPVMGRSGKDEYTLQLRRR